MVSSFKSKYTQLMRKNLPTGYSHRHHCPTDESYHQDSVKIGDCLVQIKRWPGEAPPDLASLAIVVLRSLWLHEPLDDGEYFRVRVPLHTP